MNTRASFSPSILITPSPFLHNSQVLKGRARLVGASFECVCARERESICPHLFRLRVYAPALDQARISSLTPKFVATELRNRYKKTMDRLQAALAEYFESGDGAGGALDTETGRERGQEASGDAEGI